MMMNVWRFFTSFLWSSQNTTEETCDQALDDSLPPGEILTKRFSHNLTRKDLLCLRPGSLLRDEVVNSQLFLLRSDSILVLNSYFYTKLTTGNCYTFANVSTWKSQKRIISVVEHEKVLIPIHFRFHWLLVVVDVGSRHIQLFDSLAESLDTQEYGEEILFNIKRWIEDLHPVLECKWTTERFQHCAKQTNLIDCGVFMLAFAHIYGVQSETTESVDVDAWRRRILRNLLL